MNWEAYVWYIWLGLFAIFEAIGLFSKNGMTLTFFIQHHFPKWMLACLIGWFFYHFTVAPPAMRLGRLR